MHESKTKETSNTRSSGQSQFGPRQHVLATNVAATTGHGARSESTWITETGSSERFMDTYSSLLFTSRWPRTDQRHGQDGESPPSPAKYSRPYTRVDLHHLAAPLDLQLPPVSRITAADTKKDDRVEYTIRLATTYSIVDSDELLLGVVNARYQHMDQSAYRISRQEIEDNL
ncbi:hypothetical protein BDY19DRAFT_909741 [Irpex rosettiformis]|uniref:Uncharacterized protein n=1 Tax=Irpex rosettiformis TaxID=378272 RepID=A0ACB8TR70_9APHY|nr:hypothetical protein BDY19DRAFT_909741 [Irpex rosettiformis]